MRGFLFFVIGLFSLCNVYGQAFSAEDFLFPSAFTSKKFESYLDRKKFLPTGSRFQHDTVVRTYNLKMKTPKKKKDTLHIIKRVETYRAHNNFTFAYLTSLKNEYNESLKELREEGFFCGNQSDTGIVLFQKRNLSVLVNRITEHETDTITHFIFVRSHFHCPRLFNMQRTCLSLIPMSIFLLFLDRQMLLKTFIIFLKRMLQNVLFYFQKRAGRQ